MKAGSLFSGYLGLSMAVESVFGADLAWVSDIDPGACRILEHRAPGIPNIGDITKVDWADVEPVDILDGGFPCQPVSHAGKRLGDDDERWLWDEFARAIGVLRPRYVVLENVAGLLSAKRGRLLGRVLGDLATERYDARWSCVPASRVGAPHRRLRWFCLAADAADERHERAGSARRRGRGLADGGLTAADADDARRQGAEPAGRRDVPARGTAPHPASFGRREGWPEPARLVGRPDAAQRGATPAEAESDTGRLRDRDGGVAPDAGGERHGRGQDDRRGRADVAWGPYEPAVRRWERVLGRPAPEPTHLSDQYLAMRAKRLAGLDRRPVGMRGSLKPRRQLSPLLCEWMMGLPAGWVTDVPGLTRNQMLKALGNGVVPQQAEAALRWLLAQERAA